MRPLLAAALALSAAALEQQPIRVSVDAVTVDVLVLDGNRPVPGLTAPDFDLRDNGVRQQIETVVVEDVPLRVMLALDTSTSVDGQVLADLKGAASSVVDLLAPADSAALITFSHRLELRVPWSSSASALKAAIMSSRADGATALHDAAYMALTLRDANTGRRLVLLFSDGEDTIAWLPGTYVIDAARRADAVVYAIGLQRQDRTPPGYKLDFRSGPQPPPPHENAVSLAEPFLRDLTRETGGRYIDVRHSDRLRATFVEVLTEFRSRYLLTYTPKGVSEHGWHALDVRVRSR